MKESGSLQIITNPVPLGQNNCYPDPEHCWKTTTDQAASVPFIFYFDGIAKLLLKNIIRNTFINLPDQRDGAVRLSAGSIMYYSD